MDEHRIRRATLRDQINTMADEHVLPEYRRQYLIKLIAKAEDEGFLGQDDLLGLIRSSLATVNIKNAYKEANTVLTENIKTALQRVEDNEDAVVTMRGVIATQDGEIEKLTAKHGNQGRLIRAHQEGQRSQTGIIKQQREEIKNQAGVIAEQADDIQVMATTISDLRAKVSQSARRENEVTPTPTTELRARMLRQCKTIQKKRRENEDMASEIVGLISKVKRLETFAGHNKKYVDNLLNEAVKMRKENKELATRVSSLTTSRASSENVFASRSEVNSIRISHNHLVERVLVLEDKNDG